MRPRGRGRTAQLDANVERTTVALSPDVYQALRIESVKTGLVPSLVVEKALRQLLGMKASPERGAVASSS